MANYSITYKQLQDLESSFSNISVMFQSFNDSLLNVINSIDAREELMSSLRNKLQISKNKLELFINKFSIYATTLVSICDTYRNAETKNYQDFSGIDLSSRENNMHSGNVGISGIKERLDKYRDIGFFKFNDGYSFMDDRNITGDLFLIFGNDPTRAFYDGIWHRSNRGEYIKDSLRNMFKNMQLTNNEFDKLATDLKNEVFNWGDNSASLINAIDEVPGLDITFKLLNIIKDTSDFGSNVSSALTGQYMKNIAFLDQMKDSLVKTGDKDMLNAITELREEYNINFSNSVEKVAEYIGEYTVEKYVESTVERGLDLVAAPYATIDTIRGLIYDCSGLTDYTNNLQDLYANLNYAGYMAADFSELKMKIISGDYTHQDIVRFQESFEATKAVYSEQYRLMIEMTNDSSKKAYLKNKLNKLNDMTI